VLSENRQRYRIWRLYWIDGRWVSDDREAKLLQAWMALRLRGDDGAVVLLATASGTNADAVLEKFLSSRLGALGTELNTVPKAAR
jgi:EpsI family protein